MIAKQTTALVLRRITTEEFLQVVRERDALIAERDKAWMDHSQEIRTNGILKAKLSDATMMYVAKADYSHRLAFALRAYRKAHGYPNKCECGCCFEANRVLET